MNGNNLVFDACAIIKLLDRQYNLFSIGINVDEIRLLTSFIVRMELLSKQNMQNDEERDIREFLDALTVIPMNDAIEQRAIEIRRATKLKLPDCIVAATAIVLDACLLTDDKHLLDLSWPGLRTQKIQ